MLIKNKEYVLDITGMGSEGEGVGKVDGCAVFVPYALKGEKVRVKIVKVLKNYSFGKLLEVIKPNPLRISPDCEYFYKCGGCNFWHVDYALEVEYKTNKVKDALERIGSVYTEVLPVIPAEKTVNYRNKAQFAVNNDGIGFFAPRSHRLIPIGNCAIQHEINEKAVRTVYEYMEKYSVLPYDEKSHTGDIRHIYTRVAVNTGEIMVCIVTRGKRLPHAQDLVDSLRRIDEGIVSIFQNINPNKTNVALGEKEVLLWGKSTITDKIGDLIFQISPKSFYQVNSAQTKVLYDEIIKLANFTGGERVFDLYCGIGTIALYTAKYVKEVVGVEVVGEAVNNAIKNAEINNINNAVFYKGVAEDIADSLGKADVVIVDPPRKGCDKKLLLMINTISPNRVIYVSCNPATLARDLKILQAYGFEIKTIQPVDMFPRTPHVETVVLMTRVKE